MTEAFGLLDGFVHALSLQNLLFCLLGVTIGTLVGILPGLGPVGAISIFLPATIGLEAVTALIFVAGIYFGGMYGGAITSILVNIPGEASSVATAIDGYPMAKKGRAGAALVIAAMASFVAGTLGVVLLSYLSPLLAKFALKFGPPEFFMIVLVGMVVLARLTDPSALRSYLLIAVGVLLSTIGMDAISGTMRLTFGTKALIDGLDFIPIIMGLYGLSGILLAMDGTEDHPMKANFSLKEMMPTKEEWRRSAGPTIRGGLLGFLMGLIPGPSAIISTFTSYKLEKSISRRKEEFGKGAVEGVAGPEAANNGASSGALVPLLSLGIPFSPLAAILLSAFLLQGITPGPLLISDHPDLFWTLIASMYIGNVMLFILNAPLAGILARVANIPSSILMPLILVFCFIGAYAVNYSFFDLVVLVVFGVIGYLMRKAELDLSPLIIGLVLGPVLESNFVQSMLIFKGDFTGFVKDPVAGTILAIGVAVLFFPLLRFIFRRIRGMKGVSSGF